MKNCCLILGMIAILTIGAQAAETIELFNGENLDGWYTFIRDRGRDTDPKQVFTVQDGMIRVSGEEWGCITTNEEFENYHLTVEFKWGEITYPPRKERARDCGVLVHSIGKDGGYSGIWMCSIECQMIEGGTGDFLVVGDGSKTFELTANIAKDSPGNAKVFDPDGEPITINGGRIDWWGRDPEWADVLDFRGKQDVEKPVGEWNTLECICDGDKITAILNGVVVNKAFGLKPQRGRIQLQSEGAEVFFRKVELKPLKKKLNDYRYIYNSDANNLYLYADYPLKAEEVQRQVDLVAEQGATAYFISPNLGMTMNYPTEVGDFIGEHCSPELQSTITADAKTGTNELCVMNLRALVEAGHDPVGLVIDRAKEQGMEAFISFRLNEVHAVDKDDHIILSRFWKEHPEWRIGNAGDPVPQIYMDILGPRTSPIVAGWLPGGFDFSNPEVRAFRLAQMRECCERFDLDGLDLDFQRFPMYFKPGEEAQHIAAMTDWVREIRKMTKEVGERRGREILLCARIMSKPEENLAIGLDPVTWAKEGLLDFVVVSHYLHNNFTLPIETYRDLLPVDMPIYASIEVEKTQEKYQEIADALWAQDVDGLMLFNFFTHRPEKQERDFSIMASIAKPALPDKPLLLVANKHSDTLSYIDPDSLKILDTITTGHNPHEIIITPDQRYAYLSNYAAPGDTISFIDLVARKHIKQIQTGEFTRIHGTAMPKDGKNAYFTAGQTGFVVEVDTATNEVTRGIPTHGKISHMVLVSEDDKLLYTANITSENVSVIDRASGDLIKQIPCGKGVEGMAFTPDGKYLWAANQTGGSIAIIDLATHEVIETFECPGMPVRIHFTEDGKLALVPSWTQEGVLIVIDVATRTEVKRIPVGSHAIGVEIHPNGKRAFVGCEDSDGLHIIDLELLRVESILYTGEGPDPMMMWYPPK